MHALTFMRTLNIWARNSGTDVHPEHMRQELVRALNAHMEFEKIFKTCWAYMSGTDVYP